MIDVCMKKMLCEQAVRASEKAYSPYSGFSVGAALLCDDGSIYTGCNIENSSYSATVCAERVALFSAVKDGKRGFTAIAIAGGREDIGVASCPPCGVCRQTLSELCPPDLTVLLVKKDGFDELTLGELLPHSFSSKILN